MSIEPQLRYHRQIQGHTGPIWECTGNPNDYNVKTEAAQLVASGNVVISRAVDPRFHHAFEPIDWVQIITKTFISALLVAAVTALWKLIDMFATEGLLGGSTTLIFFIVGMVLAFLVFVGMFASAKD